MSYPNTFDQHGFSLPRDGEGHLDVANFLDNYLPPTDTHYGLEEANIFNIPGQWQVNLPEESLFTQEEDNRQPLESEDFEPYFVSLCYSTSLSTPLEFFVPLSPSQLLTLEEMEENNLQQYILSVESRFGIGVNATSSEMQDSFPLPPFCGRILTRYGTFPYHSVVPLPNQNHLLIGHLSTDGVYFNPEDTLYVFVEQNSTEESLTLYQYIERMLRFKMYIGSIHADGNKFTKNVYTAGQFSAPYLKYDPNDARIFKRAQLLPLPEYERLKQSPTHVRLTDPEDLERLPIPAFDQEITNNRKTSVERLLDTGGKGGPVSVKLLGDYAPATANQLSNMDIYLQGLVLTGFPPNYTPATHGGTSNSLSAEMTGVFQSIWADGLKFFPPQNILEDCICATPNSAGKDHNKLLLLCLDFLYHAIHEAVKKIILDDIITFFKNLAMAFGWNLDPLTLPVAGQVDAFFHLFCLDLGDDEEGGLLTMMDKTDGQPFQHPLLLKIVHRLIHTETLSPAASASKRSTLGTVSSVVFTRDSLIGVPNKTFAMILAQIYLIGAAQLGQHPSTLYKKSVIFEKMISRLDAIERPRHKPTSKNFKAMKFALLSPTWASDSV